MESKEVNVKLEKVEKQLHTYSLYGKIITGILIVFFGIDLWTVKARVNEILKDNPVMKEVTEYSEAIKGIHGEAVKMKGEVTGLRDEVQSMNEEILRIPNLKFKQISIEWIVPKTEPKEVVSKKFSMPLGCTPIGVYLPDGNDQFVFGTSFEPGANKTGPPAFSQYGNDGSGKQIQRIWAVNKDVKPAKERKEIFNFMCLCER